MPAPIDYQIEIRFKEVLKRLEPTFGGGLDMDAVLFLIGVQELGKGFQKYSKRQKLELIHVATCTVLIPYGFYISLGRDSDNWPHFKLIKELPALDEFQQKHLIKEAIINYFDESNENQGVNRVEIPEMLLIKHKNDEEE